MSDERLQPPQVVSRIGLDFYIHKGLARMTGEDEMQFAHWARLDRKSTPPELDSDQPLPLQEDGFRGSTFLVYQEKFPQKEFRIPVHLSRRTVVNGEDLQQQKITLEIVSGEMSPNRDDMAPVDSDDWLVHPNELVRATYYLDLLEKYQPEIVREDQGEQGSEVRWSRHFTAQDGTEHKIVGLEVDRITSCGQTWVSFGEALQRSTNGILKMEFLGPEEYKKRLSKMRRK